MFATDNFGTVLTKNLQNPRDYAPLTANENSTCWWKFKVIYWNNCYSISIVQI